jgi:hypothetical protein
MRRAASLAALALLLGAVLAPGSALRAGTASDGGQAPDDVAASGPGVEVRFAELDELLLSRHGMAPEGRAILELLLKKHLLTELARAAGLEVTDQDVALRWAELDRQARASGVAGGLAGEVQRGGFRAEEFTEFLRLAIVQERLTRRALGLAESQPVGPEQQEVWLGQEVSERGLERPAPPWEDGVVLRCGDALVRRDEYAAMLRRRLPAEDVRESAAHLLLLRAIERRMPDLAPAARLSAVEEELARRRAEHERTTPGMTFEQRLGAAGRTLDQLRRDPAVHVAALTRLWVDRTHGQGGLRSTFEQERAFFEGRHGRAVRANVLFLVAGRFKNDLVPRTFAEAADRLRELATQSGDVADFRALCRALSEDPATKGEGGELGWVTRAREDVPAPLRERIFELVDAGGEVPVGGRALEPVRLDTGVALLWVSELRPGPSWEVMREHVHEELRRRFVERVLPGNAVEFHTDS